jgi:hypothetical protein
MAANHRLKTSDFRGSAGSKSMPDFAPPIGGPANANLSSIAFARKVTSSRVRPECIRVPPPAAPPFRLLITSQPRADVSESFHSNTISGRVLKKLS